MDYEFSGELGRGAEGTVHRAVHKTSGQAVALKRCIVSGFARCTDALASLKKSLEARGCMLVAPLACGFNPVPHEQAGTLSGKGPHVELWHTMPLMAPSSLGGALVRVSSGWGMLVQVSCIPTLDM